MNTTGMLFLSAVLAGLAGCQTQLQSHHEGDNRFTKRNAASGVEIPFGVDYATPMLQFQIKATRTLSQCVDGQGKPDVKFLFKVSADPHYVAGERFVIDYEKLSGWSKTSKIELQTYDSGVIKGFNAAADDKTGSIVGDVVKSALRIVSLAQGVPLPDPKADVRAAAGPLQACKDETIRTLALLKTGQGDLQTHTTKLVALSDEVGMLERLAGMGGLDAAGKKKLQKLETELKKQMQVVADADQNVQSLLGRISVEETVTWPTSPQEFELRIAPSEVGEGKLLRLFGNAAKGHTKAEILAAAQLNGRLVATAGAPATVECSTEDDVKSAKCARREEKDIDKTQGLFYRSPVAARLLICQSTQDSACSLNAAVGVALSTSAMAPQLGKLRLLPYRNGVFQSNELKVSFREDGSVATFSYDEKVARGKELSGAVLAGLDEVVAYRDARQVYKDKKVADQKEETSAKKKAELDELDNEIARLEKQKKITQLQAETSKGGSTSDIELETTQINAQVALLEARKKLQDAQLALAK